MKKSRYTLLSSIVLSVFAVLLILIGCVSFYEGINDDSITRKLITLNFSILILLSGGLQIANILKIDFDIRHLCALYFLSSLASFFSAVKIGTVYWGGGLFVCIALFVVIGICTMGAGIYLADKNLLSDSTKK